MQDAQHTPSRRSGSRRRLLTYALGLLVLVPLGLFVNAGPYRDYVEARERLEAKSEEVALLERENAAYQHEIDRLGTDSYLEALARKELTYARPGEDVFIVKNLPEDQVGESARSAEPEPGPLERMVDAARDLF